MEKVRQFRIPAEFLKAFEVDFHVIPPHLPVAGYITFDRAMLLAMLRNKDAAARERFAAALQTLDSNWELALVAPTEATTIGR
jgi:hypothetical protein